MSVLPTAELEPFLERYRHDTGIPDSIDAGFFIREVLDRAREFVPCEAGSVLLDHPFERAGDPEGCALYFIAAFGPAAQALIGASIPATEGVVGHVYTAGESHLVVDPNNDPYFYPRFDETHAFFTRSLLAVPIVIENSVCGVLELVNRRDGRPFDEKDRALLEIFAAYTSGSIQNLLDGRRAAEAARSDDLTGLGNDRFFHRRLAQDLEHADATTGRVALLFMDLDNFKGVNDEYGHPVGDRVLKNLSRFLRQQLRKSDIVGRYGGEEFAVILTDTDGASALAVLEKLCQDFANVEHDTERGKFKVTFSAGVASMSGLKSSRELVFAADRALYEAKNRGRNRVVLWTGTVEGAG